MRVDPNQPAMPFVKHTTHSVESYKGMPIKLELAARFMQGLLSNRQWVSATSVVAKEEGLSLNQRLAISSLEFADALISEYNKEEDAK